MHGTLKPKVNLVLLVIWLAVLSISFAASQPKPVVVLFVSFFAGAVAGALQFKAVLATSPQLLAAKTAVQVRQALRSNVWGSYSIYVLWGFAALLLALAFGGKAANPLLTFTIGYSAFALVREAVALPALVKLASP